MQRVTLVSEGIKINRKNEPLPWLLPRLSEDSHQCFGDGTHHHQSLRAFWITSQVVVSRWGEVRRLLPTKYGGHCGMLWQSIQDLIMRCLGEELKA